MSRVDDIDVYKRQHQYRIEFSADLSHTHNFDFFSESDAARCRMGRCWRSRCKCHCFHGRRHPDHSCAVEAPHGFSDVYKRQVKYKGVEYQGSHEALVDIEMWDKVQSILASRLNGERNLKHPHLSLIHIYLRLT